MFGAFETVDINSINVTNFASTSTAQGLQQHGLGGWVN